MMGRLINRLSRESQREEGWQELRTKFRSPPNERQSLEERLKEADDRAAYLRMITPKDRSSHRGGRWVYKDGKRIEDGIGSSAQGSGVVSNWDGKNLDPDSVKQHNHQLKRAGFRNNAHA
eukprot:CAMPEP_0119555590 /NCGR_PEP_ID=MMETSP1352-20130426/7754_1 /TAXON_ID=265584 /ORGANISM="Stauroneis constricta, Strain CCMP1120" /LENGTH=119 /DNA_ID=CAMNT_0007602377 /DNA_START=24 /DNA_END=379 /DNA_ORIENTATION=+